MKQIDSSIKTKQRSAVHLEALFPFGLFQNIGQQHWESKSCLGITVVSRLKKPCPSEQLYTAAIHHGELSFSKSFVTSENGAPKPKHVKQQQKW